jgi:hypothetical protein
MATSSLNRQLLGRINCVGDSQKTAETDALFRVLILGCACKITALHKAVLVRKH